MDNVDLTYVGPPRYAGALARELELRGVAARYQPPFETKDFATAMAVVSVVFAATGPMKDIVAGVRAFTARFSGTRVEGLPEQEENRTIRERLTELDQLRADGTISAEEHTRQRQRILDDL